MSTIQTFAALALQQYQTLFWDACKNHQWRLIDAQGNPVSVSKLDHYITNELIDGKPTQAQFDTDIFQKHRQPYKTPAKTIDTIHHNDNDTNDIDTTTTPTSTTKSQTPQPDKTTTVSTTTPTSTTKSQTPQPDNTTTTPTSTTTSQQQVNNTQKITPKELKKIEKQHKITFPYIPDHVDYHQPKCCIGIKRNNGLYTPCSTHVKEGQFCKACSKLDTKHTLTQRNNLPLGQFQDEISYATIIAKNLIKKNTYTSFQLLQNQVQDTLKQHFDLLPNSNIPQYHSIIDQSKVQLSKNTTRGRPKKAPKPTISNITKQTTKNTPQTTTQNTPQTTTQNTPQNKPSPKPTIDLSQDTLPQENLPQQSDEQQLVTEEVEVDQIEYNDVTYYIDADNCVYDDSENSMFVGHWIPQTQTIQFITSASP